MSEFNKKIQAMAEEIRSLSRLVEDAKRASDLPLVLSYKRAAKELDISVPTLKRMLARGQLRSVGRGDGVGIPRSAILRLAGEQQPAASKRLPRAKPPRGSTEREKIRAALREERGRRTH